MKKLFLAAFMLLALTMTKATAQDITPSPYGLPQTMTQAHKYNGSSMFSGGEYVNCIQYFGTEFTTSRNYTVKGLYSIVIDSAQYQLDSITLSQTYLVPGQSFYILMTATNNDTLKIFHDNYFEGATTSPYLLSPATSAATKHCRIYVDKYGNYHLL